MNYTQNQNDLKCRKEFEGVVSEYSPVLLRVALRRLRNVEDAEDAVQDGLLSAYKHIGQFNGRSKLSSWLTRIVINSALMKLRSRPRQTVVSLDQALEEDKTTFTHSLIDPQPNPETQCAQSERKELLGKILEQIPAALRIAFQLREMSGFSTSESALALRITTSALKSRLSRARTAVTLYLRTMTQDHSIARTSAVSIEQAHDGSRRRSARRRRRMLLGPHRDFASAQYSRQRDRSRVFLKSGSTRMYAANQ